MPANYARIWKEQLRLKEVAYEDFVTEFSNISNAYFLEKIDGQLGALVFKDERAYLISVNDIRIDNVPVLDEYRSVLLQNNISSAIIVGEVAAVRSGQILPFNKTESIVKTSYKPENAPLVHHFPFDIILVNGKKVKSFDTTLTLLDRFFTGRTGRIHIPRWAQGGIKEFRSLWKGIQDKIGVDGIVVRWRGKAIKVKPAYTADLAVIGAGNIYMPAWDKKWISYLKAAWVDKDGAFLFSTNIGSGYTHEVRKDLFKEVSKKKISESRGDLFLKPDKVIEVKYDRANIRQTMAYEYKNGKYHELGVRLSATLVIPRFLRFRDDKKPDSYDCRPEQVPNFPERR